MVERGEEKDCDQVEKRGGRKSKEETDAGNTRPVRSARMGKESCIADIVDAATHEREEGTKGAGTTRKGGNRTGMHGRMRRVTGYPTATLISRESE